MELSQNIKDKIDNYIQNHSEVEIKEAFEKIGLDFNNIEKESDYDDLSNADALRKLHKEMTDYAKYLEECTYHPYAKIEHFANILNELIERI